MKSDGILTEKDTESWISQDLGILHGGPLIRVKYRKKKNV